MNDWPRNGPSDRGRRWSDQGRPVPERSASRPQLYTRITPVPSVGEPGPPRRVRALRIAKITVAMLSVLVLGITWYGWSQVAHKLDGLSTANVIDPNASSLTSDQNILLVGLDNRTDAQGNPLPRNLLDQLHAGASSDGGDNTDTMIVIHIPAGGGKAVAFSIPRDSYVQLAGGYGMHKINSAYTYAQVAAMKQLQGQGVTGADLAKQADEAGAKNAVQTVEQFTGLPITHFASINLVGFYYISQAIGGVPVCLKAPVDDPYSGARFPAGVQNISGTQALAFVRQRHGLPDGDLDRIKRQQVFMASMARTILSAGTLTDTTKLNNLMNAIRKAVTLDTGWDPMSFAQQLANMSAGNIQFRTIPIESISYHTPSDGEAVQADPQRVQSFISNAIDQRGSSDAPSPTQAPPPTTTANNGGFPVDVRNASGVSGRAAAVLRTLTGMGFTAGNTGNASSRRASEVAYAPGQQADAQKVAQALGGLPTVAGGSVTAGHVEVYLGTDYSGPTSASSSDWSGSSDSSGSLGSSGQTGSSAPPTQPINAGSLECVN